MFPFAGGFVFKFAIDRLDDPESVIDSELLN